MIYIFLFFLIFILLIFEFDRNYYIKSNIIEYYTKNINILFTNAFYNTFYKLFYNNYKYIYDTNNLEFDNILKTNKHNLTQNYYDYNEKFNIKPAHINFNDFGEDNSYKYLIFKFNGKQIKENLQHFPIIKNIIENNRNIDTCFLSIMENTKKVPWHRGPYSGLLRYHFPIIINPSSNCYLQVMDKKLYYKNGSFLFDDTYPHKLEKNDNYLRVVLICDIQKEHPNKLFEFIHKHQMKYSNKNINLII